MTHYSLRATPSRCSLSTPSSVHLQTGQEPRILLRKKAESACATKKGCLWSSTEEAGLAARPPGVKSGVPSRAGRLGWHPRSLARARASECLPNPCSPRVLAPPMCPHSRVVNESRVLSRQNLAMAFPSPSWEGAEVSNCFRSGSVPGPDQPTQTAISSGVYTKGRGEGVRFAFPWPPRPPMRLCEEWCRKKPEEYLRTDCSVSCNCCFYNRFCFVASPGLVALGRCPHTGPRETLYKHTKPATPVGR